MYWKIIVQRRKENKGASSCREESGRGGGKGTRNLKRPIDQIKTGSLSIAVLKPPENLVVSHNPYFICSQFCDLSCHEPSWQLFCWFYLSHLCLKSPAVWESKGRLRGGLFKSGGSLKLLAVSSRSVSPQEVLSGLASIAEEKERNTVGLLSEETFRRCSHRLHRVLLVW